MIGLQIGKKFKLDTVSSVSIVSRVFLVTSAFAVHYHPAHTKYDVVICRQMSTHYKLYIETNDESNSNSLRKFQSPWLKVLVCPVDFTYEISPLYTSNIHSN